ncbi:MAG TPA: glycosyl hydrolase family 8 [Terracidiphilus sp.]|nr:glycosyl hydrolase family 8 [Terracidiphilus sp.]
MRKLAQLVGLAVLSAVLPAAWAAADVSGDWKGSFDFQDTSVELTFHFIADGNALTGSVEGLPTTPAEIHDGKIDGNNITFWLNTDYEGTQYRLVYNGSVSEDGGAIAFTFGTDSGDWSAELTASRVQVTTPPEHVNAPLGDIKRYAGDGDGAFKTGHYRDLFAEAGHTPEETKAKIEKAFQQLFHGDGQEERIYFETGANENGTLAYITDWANNDARTEGMSYGMMIAVELNKKREFDAIWNWAHTYMLITDPKNPSVGYFAWSMNTDGTPRATGPAPDGEEYFAMALYFAAHRWGNGKGIYNYQAEADKILRGMRHHPVLTGEGPFRIHVDDPPFVMPDHPWPSPNNRRMEAEAKASGRPWPPAYFRFPRGPQKETIGPMVDEDHCMIKFIPNLPGGTTDASYHMPAFYELWARWGPEEDRAFWAKAADVSRWLFAEVTGPETGLTPDQSNFDGTMVTGRDEEPMPFAADSWRSVSNWSVDYSWWHKDSEERVLSDRIQKFLYGQGIGTFVNRYTVDGKPLSDQHSPGMVATTAVGSLAATNGPISKAFVDALWNVPVPSGERRYYDGMLYLMSMLHASGEFRIIEKPAASR